MFAVSRATLMTRDLTSVKSTVSRQAKNQQRSYDENFIQSEREGSTLVLLHKCSVFRYEARVGFLDSGRRSRKKAITRHTHTETESRMFSPYDVWLCLQTAVLCSIVMMMNSDEYSRRRRRWSEQLNCKICVCSVVLRARTIFWWGQVRIGYSIIGCGAGRAANESGRNDKIPIHHLSLVLPTPNLHNRWLLKKKFIISHELTARVIHELTRRHHTQ